MLSSSALILFGNIFVETYNIVHRKQFTKLIKTTLFNSIFFLFLVAQFESTRTFRHNVTENM